MGDSAYAMSGCIKYLTDSHIPSPLRPPLTWSHGNEVTAVPACA